MKTSTPHRLKGALLKVMAFPFRRYMNIFSLPFGVQNGVFGVNFQF